MRVLTDTDIETEKTSRAAVLKLMLDYQWHLTVDINKAAGGSEGTRRLRELRQAPYFYLVQCNRVIGSRQWQYRIVPKE